jgi:large subunit ribosomal protein L25
MADLDEPVKIQERQVVGKGLGNLRREGLVPAVIHNHGQDSLHVMADEQELGKLYKQAGKHHPLNLEVGSQKFLVLIKDVQFNPVKHRMQHIVFQAIRQNETVEAEVPIRLEGEIPAEKVGLMILTQLDSVQIEALPRNLPNELVVDATKLVELHDKITVADLQVPAGITILTEDDYPIATVVETRAQMSEEAEAEATEDETTEGEAPEGDAGNAPGGGEAEAAGQESSKTNLDK